MTKTQEVTTLCLIFAAACALGLGLALLFHALTPQRPLIEAHLPNANEMQTPPPDRFPVQPHDVKG